MHANEQVFASFTMGRDWQQWMQGGKTNGGAIAGSRVGMIRRGQKLGEFAAVGDNYSIQFPPDLPAHWKAALIATAILIVFSLSLLSLDYFIG